MSRKRLRVLACGGRDFARPPKFMDDPDEYDAELARYNRELVFVFDTLDEIHEKRGIVCVIQGEARGADRAAKLWAQDRGVPTEDYPADWERYRKRAGLLRNAEMLVKGKPDVVVAFPGGTGTAHMVRIARDADVPVYQPEYSNV